MLTDIVKAVELRQVPGDVEQVKSWLKELSCESKRMLPATSCLIATARRSMRGEDASFNAWAKQELGYNRCYVSHCAKIGDMLLDSKDCVYVKLVPLSFDKLLAIARLQADEVESYARSKELAQISRDEVRSDVSRLLGEPVKATEPKHKIDDAPAYTMRDMINEAAKMSKQAIAIMAEDSTVAQAREMRAAGQSLMLMGLLRIISLNADTASELADLKSFADGISSQIAARQKEHATATAQRQLKLEEQLTGAAK